MKCFLLILLFLVTQYTFVNAWQKVYEGNLELSKVRDLIEFEKGGYEVINGSLSIDLYSLDEYPNAFNSLKYISGRLKISGNEKLEIRMNSLIEVGRLDIIHVKKLETRNLRTINGRLSVYGFLEGVFSNLEVIRGGLEARFFEKLNFPKLLKILGDLEVKSDFKAVDVIFPRLESTGNFELSSSNSDSRFAEVQFPKLKTTKSFSVGGFIDETSLRGLIEINGDLIFNSPSTFPVLKRVTGSVSANQLKSTNTDVLRMPELEVIGEFLSISSQDGGYFHIEDLVIDLPKLAHLGGNLTLGDLIKCRKINLPKIERVGRLDVDTKEINLSSLKYAHTLKIEGLDPGSNIHLESLVVVDGSFELSTINPNVNRLGAIYAPSLISIGSSILPTKANTLVYSQFNDPDFINRSIVLNGDYELVDFKSLSYLSFFSVKEGRIGHLELQRLKRLEVLQIQNSVLIDNNFLPESVGDIEIVDSQFDKGLLSNLNEAKNIKIERSQIHGSEFLDLSSLSNTLVLDINMEGLTDIDLRSLVSIGTTRGLRFSGKIREINLESLKYSSSSLNINSESLESVNLSSLKEIERLTLESEKLNEVFLDELERVNYLSIIGPVSILNVNSMEGFDWFGIRNANIKKLDLSSLKVANSLYVENCQKLEKIDLRNIPVMDLLLFINLPQLVEIVRGEGGLSTQVSAYNLHTTIARLENCNKAQERSYYTAIEKVDLICTDYQRSKYQTILTKYFPFEGRETYTDQVSYNSFTVSSDNLSFFYDVEGNHNRLLQTFNITNDSESESMDIELYLVDNTSAFTTTVNKASVLPLETIEIEVAYDPETIGEIREEIQVKSSQKTEKIQLQGNNNKSIKFGGLDLTAGSIRLNEEGYVLTENIRINNQVLLSGIVKFSENKVFGNGLISILNPISPFGPTKTIYSGVYSMEAEGLNVQIIGDEEKGLLRLGDHLAFVKHISFKDSEKLYLKASTLFDFSDQIRQVEVDSIYFDINFDVGIIGRTEIPGEIDLKYFELDDFYITYNSFENEFGGGAEIETKFLDAEVGVNFKNGRLNDLSLLVEPEKPIVLGLTGWSIINGYGEITDLNNPPPTFGLGVGLAPSLIAKYPFFQLSNVGLAYTFGESITGSGAVSLFDETIAGAALTITTSGIQTKGFVNLDDILIGQVNLSVAKLNDGLDLRGGGDMSLIIPDGDSFFYQFLSGRLTLPYSIASTQAQLHNSRFSGRTQLLGLGLNYILEYQDNEFDFDIGLGYKSLNDQVIDIESTGGSRPNMENPLVIDRIEGRSISYNLGLSEPLSVSNEEGGMSFTLTDDLENVFIRVQQDEFEPIFDVVMPQGDTLNILNQEDFKATYSSSKKGSYQSFYAIKRPPSGTYKIIVKSGIGQYKLDIVGADLTPLIQFEELEPKEGVLPIKWKSNGLNDNHIIDLFYDYDSLNSDGTLIKNGLNFLENSFEWTLNDLNPGEYWIYATVENQVTHEISTFYAENPLEILSPEFVATPSNLSSEQITDGRLLHWEGVNEADMYRVVLSPDSSLVKQGIATITLADSLLVQDLEIGRKYYWAVYSLKNEKIQSSISNIESFVFYSEGLNGAPILTPPMNLSVQAGISYNEIIFVEDPESDPYQLLLDRDIDGLTLSGDTLIWKPTNEQIGINRIRIVALDTFYNYSELEFELEVLQGNVSPNNILLYGNSVLENVPTGTFVGRLIPVDQDTNDDHTFRLSSGEGDQDNDIFIIRNDSLFTNGPIDYEEQKNSTIRVRVEDSKGASFEKSMLLTILDVFENTAGPVKTLLSTLLVDENQGADAIIANLTTEDPDNGIGDQHSYSFVDGDNNNDQFLIDGNNLVAINNLDFEKQAIYSIRIRSTDLGGEAIESAFELSVNDLNDRPTEINLSSSEVDENLIEGTIVGELSAEDQDSDTFVFELVAGNGDTDNDIFTIEAGQLLTNEVFDFEIKSDFSIRVNVKDDAEASYEKQFTISVLNVAEPEITLGEGLNFGETGVNMSSDLKFEITNSGSDGDLSISSIEVPTGFEIQDQTLTIPEGEMREVTVLFKPKDPIEYSGELTIKSNTDDSYLNVTGIGILIAGTDNQNLPEGFVNVYPNPTNSELYIELGQTSYLLKYQPKFKLVSPNGMVLKSIVFDSQLVRISVSDLSSGVYGVLIQTNSGTLFKRVLVEDR